MVAKASGLDSVFVRVTNAASPSGERYTRATSSGDDELRRTPYTAWIYSRLPLPVERPFDPPPDQPQEWAGDPLAGVETFVVNWARYTDYAASYFGGQKDAAAMQERLFEALPRGLSAILSGEYGSSLPTRTWFQSDAAEINQLPWELVAYASGHRLATGGSFVRGMPPETATPLVPVVDKLRLGLIDPDARIAPAFKAALPEIELAMEVLPLSGDLRTALRAAAEQGLEVLHIVADASVTPSYDGVLHGSSSTDRAVASSELGSILLGSRVRLISMTPPTEDPSAWSPTAYPAQSPYRAFAYFATSPYAIPTFVVPVGPMNDGAVTRFWAAFYSSFASTFEPEQAVTFGQRAGVAPIGLFLRQLQPATFRRVTKVELPSIEPSVANVQLEASQELLKQFQEVSSSLGVSSPAVDRFVKKEQKRHSKLQTDVSRWIEGVHEE